MALKQLDSVRLSGHTHIRRGANMGNKNSMIHSKGIIYIQTIVPTGHQVCII